MQRSNGDCNSKPGADTRRVSHRQAATGSRIRQIAPYVDTEHFFLTYGDGVSNVDITALAAEHEAILYPSFFAGLTEGRSQSEARALIQGDGLHPNAETRSGTMRHRLRFPKPNPPHHWQLQPQSACPWPDVQPCCGQVQPCRT